jgi:hypothetical protein
MLERITIEGIAIEAISKVRIIRQPRTLYREVETEGEAAEVEDTGERKMEVVNTEGRVSFFKCGVLFYKIKQLFYIIKHQHEFVEGGSSPAATLMIRAFLEIWKKTGYMGWIRIGL